MSRVAPDLCCSIVRRSSIVPLWLLLVSLVFASFHGASWLYVFVMSHKHAALFLVTPTRVSDESEYRWVLLYSHMLNPNSGSIPSPLQTRLLSLQC